MSGQRRDFDNWTVFGGLFGAGIFVGTVRWALDPGGFFELTIGRRSRGLGPVDQARRLHSC